MFTTVVDDYRFLGLEIPDEVVDELQALRVSSSALEFRVIHDMVSWAAVQRPHPAAVTTAQGWLNPMSPRPSCIASSATWSGWLV